MKKAPTWSAEEDLYMEENAAVMTAEEMAKTLGRSLIAVRKRACDRKLHFYGGRIQATQPCWSCKWATNPPQNPCLWSARFKPVNGWDAEPTLIAAQGIHSRPVPTWRIKSCPLYERG